VCALLVLYTLMHKIRYRQIFKPRTTSWLLAIISSWASSELYTALVSIVDRVLGVCDRRYFVLKSGSLFHVFTLSSTWFYVVAMPTMLRFTGHAFTIDAEFLLSESMVFGPLPEGRIVASAKWQQSGLVEMSTFR